MQENLVNALRTHRPQIRDSWAALLRAEPVATPLGHPDALVHLLDWTLDEIFRDLSTVPARRRTGRKISDIDWRPDCPCGRNPLLAYFAAGEQAMREALVLIQAAMPCLDPSERDISLEELNAVLHHIARREIEAFCGVCQYRNHTVPQPVPQPVPHAVAAMDTCPAFAAQPTQDQK
jgi:hypothetical protein